MTDIYDRAAATVQRVLKPRSQGGKGAEMTLTRPSSDESTYSPGGAVTPATPATYEGYAFRENYSLGDIDGTVIQRGDVKFLVAPLQTNGDAMPIPQSGDTITFGGVAYSAQSAEPMDYADKLVAITVQARK